MQRDDGTDDRRDGQAEDAAWQAIVANYGERPALDPTEIAEEARPEPADPPPGPRGTGAPAPEAAEAPEVPDEDAFVPPEAPPVPVPSLDRLAAWVGVLGSPAVLLVCLIAGLSIPTWLGWLLVVGFIGGFGYLLYRMPGSPRDPWDDGARV
ncbi:hypothetical protein [Nocardioides sp. YIM 152588]|uniref:hypothetical protein n=1 Tax=Nocardioides sp. YIM 152588 TaxID=3158259 RepID=UPI0032E51D7F